MSSFTETWGRKLKGKSSSSASSSSSHSSNVPIFKFSKGDEELLEIIDDASNSHSFSNTNTSFIPSLGIHYDEELIEFQNEDTLPLPKEKESKIIEITPISLSSEQEITPPSSNSSSLAESPSFLNTFKKNIRDKFKNEKVKWQQKQSTVSSLNSSSSLDLSSADDIANENLCFTKNSISSESFVDSKLSHSLSEQILSTVPSIVQENNGESCQRKESTSSSIKDNYDTKGSDDNDESDDAKTPKDSTQSEETPQKDTIKRSKFNFSFRSSPLKSQSKDTENVEETPPITTHRSSAIFHKIIGMSSAKNSNSPVSMKQLSEPSDLDNEDDDEQFTELIPGDGDTIERGIEADELLNISNYPPNFTPLKLPIRPPKPHNLTLHASNSSTSFLSKFQLYSILPIVIVLLVQILPVPNWVTGFITGILISIPTAFYVSVKLFQDGETIVSPSDPKEFIVGVKNISPRLSSPIFIDEEIKRKSVWMNIWPSKYGVYDPMTYDVRWTVSVLVELYGYLVELRFPRKNIPLRRMHNEAEPEVENMNFFEHQVIDLTTAEICLMPDNLPAKWMWSKKYPIQIKTYSKKHGSSEGESNSSKGEECKQQQNKSNGSDSEKSSSHPENEEESEKSEEENNTDIRTYYLFARTGREKEEWYSRFRAAANFMKDWHHENPTPETPVDKNYTTFKQMEHKFKNFMDDYYQAKNAEEAREKMLDESNDNEEENDEQKLNKKNIVTEQLAFINIFGARMWFDLHQSQVFIDFLRQKITRKLLKIKIAQYFDEVSVTTLDLGLKLPQILNASLPWQNEFGLWVDLDLEYHGVCEATVETKGIRLPTKDESEKEANESRQQGSLIDSDEADSAEEDDDIPDNFNNDFEGADIFMDEKGGTNSGPIYPGRDGLRSRMLESILKSSVVARMAETDWVKKNITGKNITLKLQLHSLKGILILNFPPPPSDRIWYGFRSPPKLDITLKPYFGGKNLSKLEGTFSTIMRLLEKRLKQEFMKVLVYPNMDDEVLSFMDHVPYYINR